ncbi:MAG: amidohydrolase [Eubacteriales bacterium]|nr:amidohydrolase [Eubacteriales bacterium]
MKKSIAMLTAMCVVSAALAGCGSKPQDTTQATEQTAEQQEATEAAGSRSEDDNKNQEKNPDVTIIVNGSVEQIEGSVNAPTALVISDGKIVYVGDDNGAMEYDTEGAEIIDVGKRTVMPTMTESHMHVSTAIQAKYEINLADIIEISEMQELIKEFVEANPELSVYCGAGWMVSAFENGSPTKDILDEVCPDKPMMLQEVDGHAYWVNSAALEALGIDKEFAKEYNDNYLENGGRIVVDANGEPTGHLKEAAGGIVDTLKPVYTVDEIKEALLEQQDWLAGIGFTSVFDAGILNMGQETTDNYYTALSELAEDGQLRQKINGSFWFQPYDFDTWEEAESYLDGWLERSKELGKTDYYRINTIKIMSDQVLEEGTAYMSEGMYAEGVLKDGNIESNNIWSGKEWMMEKVMEYAGEHGLNLHIHQIGDAAATFALNELEKAVQVYPELKEGRVCFAHCQFIKEEDQKRMAELGVSAIVAPYWAVMDDYYWGVYLPLMSSQDALDSQYPMESLEKLGINVAFHSDYVVTQPDMGWLFYSAQTRVLPQKIYDIWYEGAEDYYYRTTDTTVSQLPEDNVERLLIGPLKQWDQVLDFDQTLKAATINGAKTINRENEIGSIEVGKSADVMILNCNLRESNIEDMENVAPVRTIFEGETVYNAE